MTFSRMHRGWIMLVITILNVFASLGLARFSFGVILPFMREGLTLTYSEAGLIASAVFFGYLASAFFVGRFIHTYKEKKVIIAALIIIITGMVISAVSYQFWLAYLACFFLGVGSGAGNIASIGLVSKWFAVSHRGRALGVTNSGSGFGMVFSGLVVPFFMLWNAEGWRLSWGALAFCVLVILIINILFLIDDPAKLNMKPVGIHIQPDREQKTNTLLIEKIYRDKTIIFIGLIYFSWGFSYLIFSTFFVDFLMIHANINMDVAGKFYAAAGIISVVSGFIWGRLSDGIGRMLTLFLIYFIQTIVLVAFALTLNPTFLFIETILYALTLWAVPTVIVAAVSDLTVSLKASMAVGYITLFFGIGQWISPMITGSIVENFSYTVAFYLSAIVCCLGSIGCLYLHLSFRQKKKLQLRNITEEGVVR